ncbi:MAG: nucleoid-associated protein, YbaB/EbfC family [Candidatus Kerfeldbacteria bacterium CG08_land_8_20_14_0_20_40_16]|uniref:Nucleoid-associated protein, YbaB/EbfC family n=1 Tax=Candidatus Kerfeldbacteria bacterium CG08_land_8_20_14_0_20_40_16 TaxID=2014244 RepID=A0A2H0YUS2_9BACT|nr:MAG: nucleoid-associated protein, YbaB/EbfC family [Candidatus Kerfeldbacteria bacterium CG08_land_8_20_14_0_20_40_16]
MFNKLKQIKDLRDQAKELQGQLGQETVSTSSEEGKINLVMDGNQQVVGLEIDPQLLNIEQKETLERGLKEAYNEAVKKVQRIIAQKIQGGNFNLPNIG